ncbi:MAG: hypothetical protein KDK70_08135, partial [Myxococcales bacterium]|nr:hypothetical protein [Myxococcales bacterium]
MADPEREAWVLAAIDASAPEHRESIAELWRSLGFDPTREPHRLGGHGKREAKAVLRALVDDLGQELRILRGAP